LERRVLAAIRDAYPTPYDPESKEKDRILAVGERPIVTDETINEKCAAVETREPSIELVVGRNAENNLEFTLASRRRLAALVVLGSGPPYLLRAAGIAVLIRGGAFDFRQCQLRAIDREVEPRQKRHP
jgi:hypothetical protein